MDIDYSMKPSTPAPLKGEGCRHVMEQVRTALPGTYYVRRQGHHDQTIEGRLISHKQLVIPAHGLSTITARSPADGACENELLQVSTFHLREIDGKCWTFTEARVFYIRDTHVSIWHAEPNKPHMATTKFTDVELTYAFRRPELDSDGQLNARWTASSNPWQTAGGDNCLTLDFLLGHHQYFSMDHLLDRGSHQTSKQSDEYYLQLGPQ